MLLRSSFARSFADSMDIVTVFAPSNIKFELFLLSSDKNSIFRMGEIPQEKGTAINRSLPALRRL